MKPPDHDTGGLAAEVAALEKRVRAHEAFVHKILGGVCWLLDAVGKLTKRSQGSNHTNTEQELTEVPHFRFEGDFGQSMFGGNQVKVWYSPQPDREPNGSADLVLQARWQMLNDYLNCTIEYISGDEGWKTALVALLEKPTETVDAVRQKREHAADGAMLEEDLRLKHLTLQRRAATLGMTI